MTSFKRSRAAASGSTNTMSKRDGAGYANLNICNRAESLDWDKSLSVMAPIVRVRITAISKQNKAFRNARHSNAALIQFPT